MEGLLGAAMVGRPYVGLVVCAKASGSTELFIVRAATGGFPMVLFDLVAVTLTSSTAPGM
ncbi:hypothetical protein [Actinopolymorpha pittospori]|uniref:Uncharacterized protein n=1 Tax=Actinopolymorpha pittospori TaxID=648752 RepID=A0A927RA77_9ACTN|nr:hypothetical protein [Actinopolymorpha pittospori]MBE1608672.1 hypothetical protein [Actinopolymorpha pittospori]